MKKSFWGVLLACALAVPAFAGVLGVNDQEVKAAAEPVLANLLEGLKSHNYTVYSKDFDAILKETISIQKFTQTAQWYDDKLGALVDKQYLGFLNQEQMTVVLWKGKFAKSDGDVLIKLVMSRRGDSCVVTGLWFQ